MLCSATYRYNDHHFLDAVSKISIKFSGRYFSDTLLGMTPVVPPKANRKAERDYNRETYKFRNEIERLFQRFKGCRRLFTRFDKLDATFLGFLNLAAVFEMTHDLA